METALKNPKTRWQLPFFTIWTGQAVSLLGSRLVQFALIWWITQKTGSGMALAIASLVGLLPDVVLGPLAGALVDRWNRRVTMMAADGLVALATVALAGLFLLGWAEIWHIYVLLAVRSIAGIFHFAAMAASTSLMVPKEHLSRIQGLNQLLSGGLSIAAAPLGALVLGLLPMQGVLAIDVVTALFAIGPLFFIAVPQPERKLSVEAADGAPAAKTSIWQELAAGLRYVRGWPGLLLIMLMATVINFVLNPGFALLPLLVTEHFNGQAFHLAGTETAFGIGMVIGSVILSVWGGFKRRILTTLMGLVILGVACAAIGLAPGNLFWLALAALLITGIANPITNGPLLAVVQSTVEPEMQGRVFTLIQSAATAMMPIGLLIAGPVADYLGVTTWFIVGGAITALMGVAGFFIPALVNFEKGRTAAQPADPAPLPVLAGD
jgi:DHA3 family macrolide efflux protein-like MFS transporter